MIKKLLTALAACGLFMSGGAWARPTQSTPTIQGRDTTIHETSPYVTIALQRNGSTKKPSAFSYKTIDGTAKSGLDYTPMAGSISFGSGKLTATVSIPIINDTTVEGTETFQVKLTPTNNATCASVSEGVLNVSQDGCLITVSIIDDDVDTAPTPPPPPTSVTWVHCANEGETCYLTSSANVRYGSGTTWTASRAVGTSVACNNSVWGDPLLGTAKECQTDGTPLAQPTTKTCPDGSVIPATQDCPVTTPPTTPPPVVGGWVSSPTITGLQTIPSTFDPTLAYEATAIPGPDVGEGAFRFLCGAGQLIGDDPIVFPGQPGVSHLHQFYGNTLANAFSTFTSLRTTGKTTCGPSTSIYPVNRSGYWQPAMLDGKGHVVQPDFMEVYYKHPPDSLMTGWRPAPDPTKSEGIKAKLPNGIRFVFGWDPTGAHSAPTGQAFYYCSQGAGTHYPDLQAFAAANTCPVGAQLIYTIEAPSCWDGKNLDSPDHRSHVSYADYSNGWGYLQCPQTHPYVIPVFTLKSFYTIASGDDVSLWYLSSDMMAPGKPHGYTIHGDFFMAWDDPTHQIWETNCLDKQLNCSAGNMGNGFSISGMGHPDYGWTNPNHLVAIPDGAKY
jgi:hypothetical protein